MKASSNGAASAFPADAKPVAGESFVFTQFAGEPQCFVTEDQPLAELDAVGFEPNPAVPLREVNRRPPGTLTVAGPPVIYQGAFRRRVTSSRQPAPASRR